MFRNPTLFVLGAGASAEVEFPTGRELLKDVANRLSLKEPPAHEERPTCLVSDGAIYSSIQRVCVSDEITLQYRAAVEQIVRAAPLAISIDNLLDNHASDATIVQCGKMAIAASIGAAEQSSTLRLTSDLGDLDVDAIASTWYVSLFRLLQSGVRKENIRDIFRNLTIISFNYDRSVEFFLLHSLRRFYGIELEESEKILNTLNIYHPYGVIGKFSSGLRPNLFELEFGSGISGKELLRDGTAIRTYAEQVEENSTLSAIRDSVRNANAIVFLGFGFLKPNIELLSSGSQSEAKVVLSTGVGISASEVNTVHDELVEMLMLGCKPQIHRNISASKLFDQRSRTIASF